MAALIRCFGDLELLLDGWSTGMVLVGPMGVLLPVLRQRGTSADALGQRKADTR
jgi:hypothetical protein